MKSQKDLFVEDFLFRGEQSKQAKALSIAFIDSNSKATIFNSVIELYMASAIVGCINNKRVPLEKSGDSTRIFAEQMNNHNKELWFIFRLVMLANQEIESDVEKINNAFREPNKEENIKLFNEYMAGGLQILYERFYGTGKDVSTMSYDDYLEQLMGLLKDIKKIKVDDEIDLPDFED